MMQEKENSIFILCFANKYGDEISNRAESYRTLADAWNRLNNIFGNVSEWSRMLNLGVEEFYISEVKKDSFGSKLVDIYSDYKWNDDLGEWVEIEHEHI